MPPSHLSPQLCRDGTKRASAALVLGILLACTPGSRHETKPMGGAAHEAQARAHDRAAGAHERQAASGAAQSADRLRYPQELERYDPAARHRRLGEEHRDHARAHRDVARALRQFEQAQCADFPPERRALCPLLGAVTETEAVPGGVRVRLAPGVPLHAAVAHIRCHIAFGRAHGFEGMDECPLYLPGVRVEPTDGPHALELLVGPDGRVEALRTRILRLLPRGFPTQDGRGEPGNSGGPGHDPARAP